jgi:hypothetical protein
MGMVGKNKYLDLDVKGIFVWSHTEHHYGCSKIFIMGVNMDFAICNLTKCEHEFVKVRVYVVFLFGGATCNNYI